jgi:hypothetical protein
LVAVGRCWSELDVIGMSNATTPIGHCGAVRPCEPRNTPVRTEGTTEALSVSERRAWPVIHRRWPQRCCSVVFLQPGRLYRATVRIGHRYKQARSDRGTMPVRAEAREARGTRGVGCSPERSAIAPPVRRAAVQHPPASTASVESLTSPSVVAAAACTSGAAPADTSCRRSPATIPFSEPTSCPSRCAD